MFEIQILSIRTQTLTLFNTDFLCDYIYLSGCGCGWVLFSQLESSREGVMGDKLEKLINSEIREKNHKKTRTHIQYPFSLSLFIVCVRGRICLL